MVIIGIVLLILIILGVIYSIIFNESRWVTEMRLNEYIFSIKDIPMLIIGLLIAIYAIYIAVVCIRYKITKKKTSKK